MRNEPLHSRRWNVAITVGTVIQYDAMVAVIFVALVGYLLGSIPVADLVTRRAGAPNLREVGDRNPGYWNSRSVLTRGQSLTVFVGDLSKGSLAALCARQLSDDWRVWFLGAGAAVIGHAWPVFGKFSGGRGVLTWIGATLVLSPGAAMFCILVFALFLAATREFSHSVRIAVVLFPFAQWYSDGAWRTAATGVLMTIVGIRFVMANGLPSPVRSITPLMRTRRRSPHDGEPRG